MPETDYHPELMAIGRLLERIARAVEAGAQMPAATAGPVAARPAAAWVCPFHGSSRVVPGGISKKSGNRYNAFTVCASPGCEERPPRSAFAPQGPENAPGQAFTPQVAPETRGPTNGGLQPEFDGLPVRGWDETA